MARIRSVKPEFWSDPIMAKLSHSARLLYIGLWNYCDDEGRGQYIPKAIEGFVFPREDLMKESGGIHELLAELREAGRIVVYEAEGEEFFYIPTWHEHQKPQHPRPSKFPAPDQGEHSSHEGVMNHSGNSHETVTPVEGEGEGVTSPNGDGVFESLFEFVYRKPYEPGTTLPKSERGRLNAGVREAKDAGITADEIRARGRRYATEWRGLTRSPQALLANWTRFAPEPEVPDCENCGNRGVIWFNPAGERVAWDAADATDAAKCGECVA